MNWSGQERIKSNMNEAEIKLSPFNVGPERNTLSVSKSKLGERKMARLTTIFFNCMIIGLMFAGQSYAQDDATEAILGIWLLDEGTGDTTEDASGNGHDGTLVGGPKWIAGHFGNALDFSGSSSYVDCGNAEALNVEIFSISFWCYIPNTQGWNHMISRGEHHGSGNPGAVNWGVMMYADQETILYEAFNDTAKPSVSANTTIGEWHHVVATHSGTEMELYHDGQSAGTSSTTGILLDESLPLFIGAQSRASGPSDYFDGSIDDVGYFNTVLTPEDIEEIMNDGLAGFIGSTTVARNPQPADGGLHEDTWVTLSWKGSDLAVSHDVYLGSDFDEVNNATRDSEVFRGNQALTFYVAGFPGFAYPDGLVPGLTYDWRIDEVNDANPESPWKGDVWSFSIPPKKAYNPIPADGSDSVLTDVRLSWTPGFGAKLHTVYFGDDFDTVASATVGIPAGGASYNPGPLKAAKVYYWRIDEFDGLATYKGDVWSFSTLGGITNPNPPDAAIDITQTPTLTWTAAIPAAAHEIYLGTDPEAVRNATTASPEYKGAKPLGDETFEPGKLAWNTTYYWRVDETNDVNPDSPWKGPVWSFTTAGFAIVEDFESYTDDDANNEAIWQHWIDGFGVADNGSQVGYLLPPYAEQTIIHGGLQSMPLLYNNQAGVTNSEAALTLTTTRDWTEEGVAELSLWFHGLPASVGSFVEAPAGTYTMTAEGTDIWGTADQFHYAFKTLNGAGSMEAQVLSVQNTNAWAKAGVMIRETLEPGSKFAAVYITPGNGCRFQARTTADADATSDTSVVSAEQTAITAPYRVRIERGAAGDFRGYYSNNGTTWQSMPWNPQSIPMASNVYIGLALTSHAAGVTCEAVFSNVATTGAVTGQWANQDIGISSNAAEPLYAAISNAAGSPAVVAHDDPATATIDGWVEWRIPLQAFADQGINLSNVDKIAIGLGSKSGIASDGGSGTMYFDDIRLYQP
jgi:hypothetical protein